MSYDLEIWSKKPTPDPATLPGFEGMFELGVVSSAGGEREGWLIHVGAAARVLPEDVPPELESIISDVRYLTDLGLEPIHAPQPGRELLMQVAEALRSASDGVVLDKQTDLVHIGAKTLELSPVERDEGGLTLLELSWWFTESPLFTNEGLLALIEMMEATLLEAMPRRYGLYEPPQHLYEQTGRQHLIAFLYENAGDMIWYPHRPVASVSLGLFDAWGPTPRLGFRANYLSVSVDASALAEPEWRAKIQVFWGSMPPVLRSFYGDIRTLHGYTWGRDTYFSGPESQQHPVVGPWWRGIPPGPRHAVVLGPPYTDLWPAFVKGGEVAGDYAFLAARDWAADEDVVERVGGVPKAIRWPGGKRYARKWPFEGPYHRR